MYFTAKHKELIDQLQELCPLAFPKKPAPKVPLAYGSTKAVQAVLNVNYTTAEFLLKHWCQGKRYDLACSTAGVRRVRLDGSLGSKVSVVEAKFHKDRLDEYYANRTAPKGYAFDVPVQQQEILRSLVDFMCAKVSMNVKEVRR